MKHLIIRYEDAGIIEKNFEGEVYMERDEETGFILVECNLTKYYFNPRFIHYMEEFDTQDDD